MLGHGRSRLQAGGCLLRFPSELQVVGYPSSPPSLDAWRLVRSLLRDHIQVHLEDLDRLIHGQW